MLFTSIEALESNRKDPDYFMNTSVVNRTLEQHGNEAGGIEWCLFFGEVKEVQPGMYAARDVVEFLGY